MLNKLESFSRNYGLIQSGDHIICALSGGADSVALTFALYLLKDKLGIQLSAAHVNHNLRGEESDKDEIFVREFCNHYDIPLYLESIQVIPGKKGLEAAARDARYTFLRSLPGKIATAHTADDNAETVLLHLLRGTGLKGLGGIAPENRGVIRPMLAITRLEVDAFLEEWHLSHREDSSNQGDAFLRNRLRHHVMPLLKEENPNVALSLSQTALRLRQDADYLAQTAAQFASLSVSQLRQLHPALRNRILEGFLKTNGIPEPESSHISLAESLVFSENPSARGHFPGNITITRQYDTLVKLPPDSNPKDVRLNCPGVTELPQWHLRIHCEPAETLENTPHSFTICPQGTLTVRSRRSGDAIRLPGGTKSLKKLFIDRKIPAAQRPFIPVLADDAGVVAVYGIGIHSDRAATQLPAIRITIEKII